MCAVIQRHRQSTTSSVHRISFVCASTPILFRALLLQVADAATQNDTGSTPHTYTQAWLQGEPYFRPDVRLIAGIGAAIVLLVLIIFAVLIYFTCYKPLRARKASKRQQQMAVDVEGQQTGSDGSAGLYTAIEPEELVNEPAPQVSANMSMHSVCSRPPTSLEDEAADMDYLNVGESTEAEGIPALSSGFEQEKSNKSTSINKKSTSSSAEREQTPDERTPSNESGVASARLTESGEEHTQQVESFSEGSKIGEEKPSTARKSVFCQKDVAKGTGQTCRPSVP